MEKMRIVLFKNTRKEKDTHPDMTGNVESEGKKYPVSVWKKVKGDNEYLSGEIDFTKEIPVKPAGQ